MAYDKENLLFRVLGKIRRSELDDPHICWEWAGPMNRNGYGRIRIQGKWHMAHRLLYELLERPIPEGLVLDHVCRNRFCCKPGHMEPVTVQVNTLRGDAVLFSNKGES